MSDWETAARAEEPRTTADAISNGGDNKRAKHYTLKPITTPLQKPTNATLPPEPGASEALGENTPASSDPFLRATHEDDDGYDPFSDRPEERPLFEKNPWD